MSKIISIANPTLKSTKTAPLTLRMIATLVQACNKQKAKIPFGPDDLKGACMALINRGLIIRKKIGVNDGYNNDQWQVSDEAISLLNSIGIEVEL